MLMEVQMVTAIKRFLALESSGGIVLFLAALCAMVWVNSPLAGVHQVLAEKYLFFINEGLMTLFFLVVGLELKRGYYGGQYDSLAHVLLPAFAALGGMLMPAIIYIGFNYHDPEALRGWATPVATDIAFAIGVLSLCGKRISPGLRMFLLALAIYDDIGAILIIALFYSHGISLYFALAAAALVVALYGMNRQGIKSLFPYLLVGVALWYALLRSGIHPTICGVLLALFLPEECGVEEALHPWAAWLVMPLFALANAGFPLDGMAAHLGSTVVIGIVLGLFFGKQMGVFGFSWLLIRMGFASLPGNCGWRALYGVALICGIGFTMSLFLGTLSFQEDSARLVDIRLGVLLGSVLSGVAGALLLLGKEKPH
jgi:Na+:H+ antiporter, NhaA family